MGCGRVKADSEGESLFTRCIGMVVLLISLIFGWFWAELHSIEERKADKQHGTAVWTEKQQSEYRHAVELQILMLKERLEALDRRLNK